METRRGFNELINSGKPVLVDFFATWCGPCKMMTPVLQELKQKTGDELVVIKIDVDRSPEAAGAFGIQGVPTLILFQNGNIIWRQSGVVPLGELLGIVRKYIPIVS
jgi:thioredoxin 1